MRTIVSMTSYPERIDCVSGVIKSILIQTVKPDIILLWLSQEQFVGIELPEELKKLQRYGLEIKWCKDLKPHKKYFYTMQEYKDDIVILVDDDVYYSPTLIEDLLNSYYEYPNAISCMRAHRITINEENEINCYSDWEPEYDDIIHKPLNDVCPVGVGGVLYPPHSIPEFAFNEEIVEKICLFQDDLWLKFTSLINGFPTVIVKDSIVSNETIRGTQKTALYKTVNRKGNDIAIKNIVDYFKDNYDIVELLKCYPSVDYISRNKQVNDKEKYEILSSKLIYIYGAGEYAQIATEYLNEKCNLSILGYIVSEKKYNSDIYQGKPVYALSEIPYDNIESVLIVSVQEQFQPEIEKLLKNYNFYKIYYINDVVMKRISFGKKNLEKGYSNWMEKLEEKVLEDYSNGK